MSRAEKFISDYTRNCSNLVYKDTINGKEFNTYNEWLTPDQARRAVEIAREDICEWLLNHNDYITVNGNITSYDMEKLVDNLKQAIRNETQNI